MKEALQNIRQSADALIAQAADAAAVDELRVRFLGKKGELTAILKQMGRLSAEERPVVGALANEVREAITADIARRTKELESAALAARLAAEEIDVTLPGKAPAQGKRHPFEQVLGELKEIFLGMGFDIVSGPEVELDHYNFEMLNIHRNNIESRLRILSQYAGSFVIECLFRVQPGEQIPFQYFNSVLGLPGFLQQALQPYVVFC